MQRDHARLLAAALLLSSDAAACSRADTDPGGQAAQEPTRARGHTAEQQRNLAKFDDLDFRVYSGQKWDEFPESHAADVLVHYPDGSTTTGIPDHVARLKPQFVFAPDTKIRAHPIKLADSNFTAVEGIMAGTFSRPMDLGGGKVVQPTGRTYALAMMTVARWENGVIKEEWLFWDNAAFMKQIGAAQ